MNYGAFLEDKASLKYATGFDEVPPLHPRLFDFQRALVEWSLLHGRTAIFADCGMGKTPMQLVWAREVARKARKPVLIIAPLAVTTQTVHEAVKFEIDAARSQDGTAIFPITVTNYERLHHFSPHDFAGCVCDESSILKSFDGATRNLITGFMLKMEFRLLCTATAAPNDYTELGTSSEALGYLGHVDMLNRFFKNDQGNAVKTNRQWEGAKWRFKGHARQHFWRWACSWARALRRPSDLGFQDDGFHLPPLVEHEHIVAARSAREGMLFNLPAVGLWEEREEARRTINERCEKVAELVNHDRAAVCWCHLNDEGDRLAEMIPDAVQIAGADEPEEKESKFLDFAAGNTRVLVIKPKIGAWGLNWQHCAHMTFFPSHSFEQYYQAVRRCWRFGQTQPVTVDVVATEGGHGVMENLKRKATAADEMFTELVAHMNNAIHVRRDDAFHAAVTVPSWMKEPA